MNSEFKPSNNKSLHVGTSRSYTTISWPEWHRRYTPDFVRCIVYKEVNGMMRDMEERSFYKSAGFTGSVTDLISKDSKIILLEWRDSDLVSKANSFLNNCLPVDKSQRFHDGIVGIGLGRWLKTLFMTIIIKTESERSLITRWFQDLVRFTASVTALSGADQWFDVIRTALRTNDSVEDILPFRLLQAILKVNVPRQRMFRWFETSIHRSYKRGELRTNMLGPMVWLYTDRLLDRNMPEDEALRDAFGHLMTLSSYSDLEVVRLLLREIFPEVASKAEEILGAIQKKTPWSDTVDTIFRDQSVLGRKIADMPYGIKMIAGTIQMVPDQKDVFAVSTAEYNNYTPFMIRLPEAGTDFQITVYGKIIAKDQTSRFGPGMVCRTFKDYARSGKDFMGIMGLSLVGGRGNGRTAPTMERSKPSYLISAPSSAVEMELATIVVKPTEYSLRSSAWSEPLKMSIGSDHKIFAVFMKGFTDLRIRVHPGVNIATPSPPQPTPSSAVAHTSHGGIRFSDLVDRARIMT